MSKYFTLFFLLIYILNSCAQEIKNNDIIFVGQTIEEAINFENSIKSNYQKGFATIVLSSKIYPFVGKYELNNPKEFSRIIPEQIPGNVEYFYDKNSREIKYVTYQWAFINKVDDDTLFNRTKLREMVAKECEQLQVYAQLFLDLEKLITTKYSEKDKSVVENLPKKKLIEWEDAKTKGVLKLEFQDCINETKLLPGWFIVSFIEYSK
ncbi:MAG: hypothetical protein ABJM06_15000 [Gilvibacter sp.]